MLSALVVNKIISIYIGPAGIALIGQYQSVLAMITTLGNGAVNVGVTKYVSQHHDDHEKRNSYISAAIIIVIIFSFLMGSCVFFASKYLSLELLKTDGYSLVFKILGISLVLIGLNSLILSILNGLKKIKQYVTVIIVSSVFTLAISSALTMKYHLAGFLYSSIIIQVSVFFFSLRTLLQLLKKQEFSFKFRKKINLEVIKKLFAFSLMSVVTIVAAQLNQIAIRDYLISHFSIEQAGYWQAVWKISDMYLMVIITALTTYYLPKLSELNSKHEIRKEMIAGYKVIIPFVLVSAAMIYLLRDFIIEMLFTPQFMEMRTLFAFQLVGDFFKIISWVLSSLMVAKAMTKTYIFTEIIFSITFYLLTITLTKYYGLQGVTVAFAVNYILYLATNGYIFKDIIILNKKLPVFMK